MAWQAPRVLQSLRAFGYYLGEQALHALGAIEEGHHRVGDPDSLLDRLVRILVHFPANGRRQVRKISCDRLLHARYIWK